MVCNPLDEGPSKAQQGPLVTRGVWESFTGVSTTGNASRAAPHPGVRINQYEIIKLIGEGGMGSVFLARDLRLDRRVAIKFLRSNQPELTQRFVVEARTTARCQHDNIVVIYEVGEHNGAPYIVLEYLSGQTLTHLTENSQRLPSTRTVEIMCSILRALQCAHEQGIVHRDLKPDNIFITESGTIKVLDFGIAKVLQQSQQEAAAAKASGGCRMPSPLELTTGSNTNLTLIGTIMGTLEYMSPEQWGIGIEIDHLTDIWACGILLHRMICGRHPLHPRDGNQLVVTAMLDLPMPSMAESAPISVPRELIRIVDRCLLKAKEQRWQSAGELLSALELFRSSHLTSPPSVTPVPASRSTPTAARDDCPYIGLPSFQESDTARFFGRRREVAALIARIRDCPMVTLVGSSGIGKSSLVRAGVVPALKRSAESWETLIIRPGGQPLAGLASITPMAATATNLAEDLEKQKHLVETLRRTPGHLGNVLQMSARRDNRRVLVFVDQLEELYTNVHDEAERAAFIACLAAVSEDATSPLRVVLSIRSGFLGRLAEDLQSARELTRGLFYLEPPDREDLRDAIIQPAEQAGFQFEDTATVEDMLDLLGATPEPLPLLQIAGGRLWESRDVTRGMLTQHAYATMGGVAGAVVAHADELVAEIGALKAVLIRTLLVRLITSERARASVPRAELRGLSDKAEEIERLIDELIDARLLVSRALKDGKGSAIEIAHDCLVQRWPLLQSWLAENQEDAALIEQLRIAAHLWQQKNYDAGLLWRGTSAAEATAFLERNKGPLSDVESSFLDAVARLQAAEAPRWWKRLFSVIFPVRMEAPSHPLAVGTKKVTIKTKQFIVHYEETDDQGTSATNDKDVRGSPATTTIHIAPQAPPADAARTNAQTTTLLVLASNPPSTSRLALDDEARAIEQKVWASDGRHALVVKTRFAVRTDDLMQALNQDRPTIVHFSGHGSGATGIVLHDDRCGMRYVKAKALRRLFGSLKGAIRLVVLNACGSVEQASAIAEVIDCVVAMSDKVGDNVARVFSASFYRAIGFGCSVKDAFDQGLAAIDLEDLGGVDVPKLLTRPGVNAKDIRLVQRD